MSVRLEQRPVLSRAARLRFDSRADSYVLLSPERGLRLNASATAVVQRCTGELNVGEIIAALLAGPPGEPAAHLVTGEQGTTERVTEDVLRFLSALYRRQLLVLEPPV
jgi:coenzyme PQQ biosynthesis protein PqqD